MCITTLEKSAEVQLALSSSNPSAASDTINMSVLVSPTGPPVNKAKIYKTKPISSSETMTITDSQQQHFNGTNSQTVPHSYEAVSRN
jgi:hypothetical protein